MSAATPTPTSATQASQLAVTQALSVHVEDYAAYLYVTLEFLPRGVLKPSTDWGSELASQLPFYSGLSTFLNYITLQPGYLR